MTPATRLIACPRFRWMPGMLDIPQPGFEPFRVRDVRIDTRFPPPHNVTVSRGSGFTLATNLGPPDLADPATLGCLLALVREHVPNAYAEFRMRTWTVWQPHYDPACFSVPTIITLGTGATEAEALIVALESAPC